MTRRHTFKKSYRQKKSSGGRGPIQVADFFIGKYPELRFNSDEDEIRRVVNSEDLYKVNSISQIINAINSDENGGNRKFTVEYKRTYGLADVEPSTLRIYDDFTIDPDQRRVFHGRPFNRIFLRGYLNRPLEVILLPSSRTPNSRTITLEEGTPIKIYAGSNFFQVLIEESSVSRGGKQQRRRHTRRNSKRRY
jgi:hypothetical protein